VGEYLTEVVENKMVGDAGFEPATSTVCKHCGKGLPARKKGKSAKIR